MRTTISSALALCLGACGTNAISHSDGGHGADAPQGSDARPAADADPNRPDADPTQPDAMPGGGGLFPPGAIWTQPITGAAVDPTLAAVPQWLADNGGWGFGHMQIDFSIEVLEADATTPYQTFTPTVDFYDPDCDHVPFPVPAGGVLEGEDGYACVHDGDCHLLVIDHGMNKLYEMWRANIDAAGTFYGGCAAVWNLALVYPPDGRGDQCSSADAAGYPITPLLFTADEVAAGHIDHAIRFILPNPRIAQSYFVHPATHGAGSGPDQAVPYGSRWRLRPDFDLASLPNEAARTVARAMQTYGMFLADGGNVALTARSDRFSTAKWDGLLGPLDLQQIQPTDFEIVEAGAHIPLTFDCVRNGN